MKLVKSIGIGLLSCSFAMLQAAVPQETILVTTGKTDLVLKVDTTGRLCQSYFGTSWSDAEGIEALQPGKDAYQPYDLKNFSEPAFRMVHADGNTSSLFKYVSHTQEEIKPGVTRTVVTLRDEVYPVEVKLFYETYSKENIVKAWTEISHQEKKPVLLQDFASSLLYFSYPQYYLTEFTGKWGNEVNMTEERLAPGRKILDTRLGARAAMLTSPFFILSLNGPARENEGEVLLGTLNWTGNFRFTFDIDNNHDLRVVSGINPYASEYRLQPQEVFRTPEFVFAYSDCGTGAASRSFHNWARDYQLKEGRGPRLTLLNNWEATGFNFDEQKLSHFMQEAATLGVDMFLLDDGWFGNKYPRSGDKSGLGDWEATKEKLPHGVAGLVSAADSAGVKFGIWVEPEMVNPQSELYEKHPEWVIHYPNREPYYYRNQLALDLCNPEVQDYVFGIIDKLLSENPGLAYFKWDCNSMLTNPYSFYLKENQSHLFIEYVHGLYNVLDRLQAKYPHVPMMLCSGGGARCDYGALKYFTEFWASDNTDPIRRIFIQWGFSYFFPSKSIGAHVTSWGEQSIKFRTDVAMMDKLGFDINMDRLSEPERQFCRDAVKTYNRLSPIIQEGDQYRLVSPYGSNHAAVMYMTPDKNHGVLFAYDMYPRKHVERLYPIQLNGLDPQRKYKLVEINKMDDGSLVRPFVDEGKVYTGEYLMKVGVQAFSDLQERSRVIEIIAQ